MCKKVLTKRKVCDSITTMRGFTMKYQAQTSLHKEFCQRPLPRISALQNIAPAGACTSRDGEVSQILPFSECIFGGRFIAFFYQVLFWFWLVHTSYPFHKLICILFVYYICTTLGDRLDFRSTESEIRHFHRLNKTFSSSKF